MNRIWRRVPVAVFVAVTLGFSPPASGKNSVKSTCVPAGAKLLRTDGALRLSSKHVRIQVPGAVPGHRDWVTRFYGCHLESRKLSRFGYSSLSKRYPMYRDRGRAEGRGMIDVGTMQHSGDFVAFRRSVNLPVSTKGGGPPEQTGLTEWNVRAGKATFDWDRDRGAYNGNILADFLLKADGTLAFFTGEGRGASGGVESNVWIGRADGTLRSVQQVTGLTTGIELQWWTAGSLRASPDGTTLIWNTGDGSTHEVPFN